MRKGASFAGAGAALLCLALLAGCGENDGSQSQAPLARVDAVTAEVIDFAPRATLTGTIQAQVQNDLSFRISGKIIERNIDVGDHVTADQVLARLDPRTQEADVESAKAGRYVGPSPTQAGDLDLRSSEESARQRLHDAQRASTRRTSHLRTAQAALDFANAQLTSAQDQLSYTVLRAERIGVITARFAEVGQVVEPARAMFTIARDGPRDAVFDVYEAIFALVPDDAKARNCTHLEPEYCGRRHRARGRARGRYQQWNRARQNRDSATRRRR